VLLFHVYVGVEIRGLVGSAGVDGLSGIGSVVGHVASGGTCSTYIASYFAFVGAFLTFLAGARGVCYPFL